MFRPEHTAPNVERLAQQRLCRGEVAFKFKSLSEIVHRLKCIWVLRSEGAALYIKRMALQPLCFRVLSLPEKNPSQ